MGQHRVFLVQTGFDCLKCLDVVDELTPCINVFSYFTSVLCEMVYIN